MKTLIIGKYMLPDIEKPSEIDVEVDWEWIVLRERGDRVLLISKNVVDWEFYSGLNTFCEPAKPSTWEESYMREHLAGFYDKCFTAEEKERILTNETGDHLFLLTADEAREYFPTDEQRTARIVWAEDKSQYNYCWWLNSVGESDNAMQFVDEYGKIDEVGVYNDSDEVGVRPAMWIKRV